MELCTKGHIVSGGEVAQLKDRRHSLRYPCEAVVTCQTEQSRLVGRTRNISIGGICFVLDRELQGTFTITFSAAWGHKERVVKAVHHRRVAGSSVIGCVSSESLVEECRLTCRTLCQKPFALVVEEDEGMRDLLGLAFRSSGLNVCAVASGLEAIAMYREHHDSIPIALVDVGMKGMDGMETIAALRSVNPDLMCWSMTGGLEKHSEDDLLNAGAGRILMRPFSLPQVASELKRVCGDYRTE